MTMPVELCGQVRAGVTLLAALASCLLLCQAASAETIVQRKGAVTLEVRFEQQTPHLALSDTIQATLVVEGDKDLEVKWPLAWPASSPWILVEVSARILDSSAVGRFHTRQTYIVAPREPGKAVPFIFLDVETRDGFNMPRTISFDPIVFTVTTSIASPERDSMRDITGIEEVPSPAVPVQNPWLARLALVLLPLMAILLLCVRRALRRRQPRRAVERALYEWQRLVALKLPDQGRGERFMTLLTLMLRDFLERAYHLPARRRTTAEFLRSIPSDCNLSSDDRSFLAQLLERGDTIKFANVAIGVEECRAWADLTRQFLQRLRDTPVKKAG